MPSFLTIKDITITSGLLKCALVGSQFLTVQEYLNNQDNWLLKKPNQGDYTALLKAMNTFIQGRLQVEQQVKEKERERLAEKLEKIEEILQIQAINRLLTQQIQSDSQELEAAQLTMTHLNREKEVPEVLLGLLQALQKQTDILNDSVSDAETLLTLQAQHAALNAHYVEQIGKLVWDDNTAPFKQNVEAIAVMLADIKCKLFEKTSTFITQRLADDISAVKALQHSTDLEAWNLEAYDEYTHTSSSLKETLLKNEREDAQLLSAFMEETFREDIREHVQKRGVLMTARSKANTIAMQKTVALINSKQKEIAKYKHLNPEHLEESYQAFTQAREVLEKFYAFDSLVHNCSFAGEGDKPTEGSIVQYRLKIENIELSFAAMRDRIKVVTPLIQQLQTYQPEGRDKASRLSYIAELIEQLKTYRTTGDKKSILDGIEKNLPRFPGLRLQAYLNKVLVSLLDSDTAEFTESDKADMKVLLQLKYHTNPPFFDGIHKLKLHIQDMLDYAKELKRENRKSEGDAFEALALKLEEDINRFAKQSITPKSFAEFNKRFKARIHSEDINTSQHQCKWQKIAKNLFIGLVPISLKTIS